MKINDVEMNVDDLVKDVKFSMHKNYHGILLTDNQVSILKMYGFDIGKYTNIKQLMFDLGEFLNENTDVDDLEVIYEELAEFNYYNYTTK